MKLVPNALGRMVPEEVPELGRFEPYGGLWARLERGYEAPRLVPPLKGTSRRKDKLAESLEAAVRRSGLESGMTVSFHHHLRNGDALLPQVLGVCENLGIRNLTLAPSSLTDAHEAVADFVRRGWGGSSTPPGSGARWARPSAAESWRCPW